MELSVQENPLDDRATFWLGREYVYYKNYDKGIETLKKHLSIPTAKWNEERSASMRFIAKCYEEKGNLKEARLWLFRALAECPDVREPYLALVKSGYKEKNWPLVYAMVTLGCMPTTEAVSIDKGIDIWKNFGTSYFLERREVGIFNIGGAGKIVADGEEFKMGYKDCLYITKGTKEVTFTSEDASNPAKFYMVSAPAHKSCKTTFIPIEKAAKKPLGAMEFFVR